MRPLFFFCKRRLLPLLAGLLFFSTGAAAQNTVISFPPTSSQYSVYSNGATDIATGMSVFGESDVLFGGVVPNVSPGGQTITSATINASRALCDGCSINVAGKFYNRYPDPFGGEAGTNEIYLMLLPTGATPPGYTLVTSEGVLIGGQIIGSTNLRAMAINYGDATQPRQDIFSIPNSMPLVPNRWNIFSAQFQRRDIAGVPHLFVVQALMNGTSVPAFSNVDLFHAPFGNSQFSWLGTSASAGIGVDDYAAWMYAVTSAEAVGISKSFLPASIDLGGSTTLTLTASNGMLLPSANLTFTDTLPSPLLVGPGGVTSNTCGGTVTAAPGGNTVAITGGVIPSASVSGGVVVPGSCAISVDVQWPAAATAQCSATLVTNTIGAGDVTTDLGSNAMAATADIQCPGRPVFGLVKTVSDANTNNIAEPDELLTYSLQITNTGSVAGSVTITDPLPANTSFVSASNGGASSGNDVVWSGVSIPAATASTPGQVALTLTVKVDNPLPQSMTTIANQAVLDYPGAPGLLSCPDDAATQPCGPTKIRARPAILPVPMMSNAGFVILAFLLLAAFGCLQRKKR